MLNEELIVAQENMATVWAISHLVPFLVRFTGSSNALIHRKKRTTMIPR